MVLADSENKSDILIIGGGVIGMSLARELKKKGAGTVTLLERGQLGREASFAAAGMLAPQCDAEKHDDFFDLCYEGRGLYENFAAGLEEETGINVELDTSGTLFISFNAEDSKKLEDIYNWQNAAGFEVEKLNRGEILALEPNLNPDLRDGLFFPRDAQVNNRLLVEALAESVETLGIAIHENSTVTKLLIESGRICGAETPGRIFYAPVVVLATGAWSSLIKYGESYAPFVEVAPVRGQMISFSGGKKLFSLVINTTGGYLVPRADKKVLIGATVEDAGFDKSMTEKGLEYLLKCAHLIAPGLKGMEIAEKWAGLRPRAADNLPILGKYKDMQGLFIATAHYRNGILLAPLTAKILAEQILEGKTSKYLEVFSPDRFKKSAVA